MLKNEWRETYISLVKPFLANTKYFEGGELCQWCRKNGIGEPVHHNEWVSMPQILQKLKLIEPIGKVQPTTSQTHISHVTKWRSVILTPAVDPFDEFYER